MMLMNRGGEKRLEEVKQIVSGFTAGSGGPAV